MADDQNQRPYRLNETIPRATPAASASGSDPLAELARLIGQNDPFAEFGRGNARRAAAPPPAVNRSAPPAAPAAPPSAPEAPLYGASDGFLYQDDAETAGHPAAETGGFEPDPYHPSNAQLAGEEEDFYDDVPPAKRRMGIMAIAAIFALAVIGTAGAFGYRALFGTSGPSQPPPVIKADTAPSKIVPVTVSKAPNKLITDRVADRAQDEKLVSREEQPVAPPPPPLLQQAQGSAPQAAPPAALGSGVISSEPKKIRTIAIHPDQSGLGDNQPVVATAPAPPPPPPARMAPAPTAPTAPPAQAANNPPVAANPESPPRQTESRAVPPAPRTTASGNAPLSLSPDASAAPAARAPMRTAAVAAPAPIARAAKPVAAAASGSYAVQVSSQRSEADAQAAFRSLQAKFPNQLGGKQALIHKVELGDKGIYYRAMVGPFANANEASELCSGLKAAGGQCIVQRN
ncbi:MAG TPA: SPOR domain-containing protein [Pseudolabrys sp.]|nr:SPOR domain-containing protein [Pseudolabrys sp.]